MLWSEETEFETARRTTEVTAGARQFEAVCNYTTSLILDETSHQEEKKGLGKNYSTL